MTRSSPRPTARTARSVDELIAAEWDPEELHSAAARVAGGVASSEEQDALIEAITEANAAREAEIAAELERCRAEAYARGYAEGRQEGEAAEGTRLRHAVAATADALDALRAGESRWLGATEENLCALAVAVARQLIGREVRDEPGFVLELVRRALTEFPLDQPIRIRVSPQDLALISESDASEGEDPAAGRQARWVADPLITPGGCMVEGRERIVDGRVDAGLERIYRRLTYTHA